MLDGNVYYTSRYTSEGVVRRAKRDGYLSTNVFGLNPNTPLKYTQDPCSALLGAQVSRVVFSQVTHALTRFSAISLSSKRAYGA